MQHGRKFDFDLNNNAASNSVFFCERHDAENYTEIGSTKLLKRLKESHYRQIIIYIHGFSNLPEDVFDAAAEFQGLCDRSKQQEVLVLPLVWPCDNDLGLVQDYWDDQKAADYSASSFARVLQKFITWRNSEEHNPRNDPCLKRINVLAHSMGNRVLRQTLVAWNKYDLADGVPLMFRNTFLVAANLKHRIASRRLGHTGPENIALTPRNVYTVECDDVNNVYDNPKGHSYFRSGRTKGEPGLVFDHIFDTILSGRVFPDDEFRRTTIIKE